METKKYGEILEDNTTVLQQKIKKMNFSFNGQSIEW